MIITKANTAAALPIEQFAKGIELSPEDKATVETVCGKVRHLEGLKIDYAGKEGAGLLLAQAEAELGKNPSRETVAGLENAAMQAVVFDQVRTRIQRTLNVIRDREIASLGPIAAGVIDRIADNVRKAESDHKRALAKSPLGGGEDDGMSARIARTLEGLGEHRGRVLRESAGLDFLCRLGLAEDPFEAAEIAALEAELDDDLDKDFH